MTNPDLLAGQVAIVTGASSGLGDRFARVLHAAGATVVISARRLDRLEQLAGELGDRVVPIPCDVADEVQRAAFVDAVLGQLGHIDILVNNAGVSSPAQAEDLALDVFRQSIEVNLVAVFHLSQLVGRAMLAQGSGAIVNVSSILGLVAGAPIADGGYCAAKGGVVNLTRELSGQWARRGVRVNSIAPGWFESEMTDEMFADQSTATYLLRNTPLGRRGAPDELDAVLLLLAGPGGSFVHGQTIVVDGGWTSR